MFKVYKCCQFLSNYFVRGQSLSLTYFLYLICVYLDYYVTLSSSAFMCWQDEETCVIGFFGRDVYFPIINHIVQFVMWIKAEAFEMR